jgi:hypothetical protein
MAKVCGLFTDGFEGIEAVNTDHAWTRAALETRSSDSLSRELRVALGVAIPSGHAAFDIAAKADRWLAETSGASWPQGCRLSHLPCTLVMHASCDLT